MTDHDAPGGPRHGCFGLFRVLFRAGRPRRPRGVVLTRGFGLQTPTRFGAPQLRRDSRATFRAPTILVRQLPCKRDTDPLHSPAAHILYCKYNIENHLRHQSSHATPQSAKRLRWRTAPGVYRGTSHVNVWEYREQPGRKSGGETGRQAWARYARSRIAKTPPTDSASLW